MPNFAEIAVTVAKIWCFCITVLNFFRNRSNRGRDRPTWVSILYEFGLRMTIHAPFLRGSGGLGPSDALMQGLPCLSFMLLLLAYYCTRYAISDWQTAGVVTPTAASNTGGTQYKGCNATDHSDCKRLIGTRMHLIKCWSRSSGPDRLLHFVLPFISS